MAKWTASAVESDGTLLAALTDATVVDVEWVYNAHGGATLIVPIGSAGSEYFDPWDSWSINVEVQIFRDTSIAGDTPVLARWVVPTRIQKQGAAWHVQCAGVSWLLSRLQIDQIPRHQYISNGDMESLTGWSATGCTATAETGTVLEGAQSVQLDGVTGPYANAYYSRRFQSAAFAAGIEYTAAAWVYIDSWTGPALNYRGLYLQRVDSADGTTVLDFSYDRLTGFTERGKWVRLETKIVVPATRDDYIDIRLYAPDGVVFWDAVQVVAQDSLSQLATDQATIIDNIVAHCQDPSFGKPDINITCAPSATTVLLDKVYFYAEHINAWDAITAIVDGQDGPDISTVETTTTREVLVHYPRLASAASTVTLTYGPTRDVTPADRVNEIIDYTVEVDITSITSALTVIYDGTLPAREEYTYALGGSHMFQSTEQSRPGGTVGDLRKQAQSNTFFTTGSWPVTYTVQAVPSASVDVIDEIITGGLVMGHQIELDVHDLDGIDMDTILIASRSCRVDCSTEVATIEGWGG